MESWLNKLAILAALIALPVFGADVPISGLPAASSVSGSDVVPIVQSATTKKASFTVQKAYYDAFFQPLDGDLTALAALSGTHTIYYRSASNTWSAVTIGSGLLFSGATLSATGSGSAPDSAHYLTSQAESGLSAEVNLGALTSGMLYQTVSGSVATPAIATIDSPLGFNTGTGHLSITGSALTKSDDTNVTLTLGGSPTTALLSAASITAGWTGTLSQARGGFGKSSAAVTDGQIPIGKTSDGSWNFNTITAGTNITITNGAGTITIDASGGGSVDDTAFASSWNGVTTTAPSKNAVYDWGHTFDTDDDGKVNVLDIGAGIPKTDAGGVVSVATADTDYTANAFKTISVSGQSDVVADSASDTLTLAAGSNVTLTTNAGTDTVTIAASGASSGNFTGHGDSNYTILSTDAVVYTNANFTNARTWTLPAASALTAGQTVEVIDLQATVTSTNFLTVQRAGSDTIFPDNGGGMTSTSINAQGGGITFMSDGSSKWYMTKFQPGYASNLRFVQATSTKNWMSSSYALPSTVSTSGKLMQSDGSNIAMSTATWPGSGPSSGAMVKGNGTNYVAQISASNNALPSDPTGTTDTTGKMMGIGTAGGSSTKGGITTGSATSGKIVIVVSGTIFNATAIADGAKVQIRHGTGSAPANGDALTGTADGSLVQYIAATTAEKAPFSLNAIVTGLSASTSYWIDLGLAAITGGTAQVSDVSISAYEL